MKRIFLIGYMGAGKTTLGRELSKLTKLDFIDLDLFIETRYTKTIAQLFEEFGETHFRKIEHNILKELISFENVIISTGGGTPCFFDNIDIMNNNGHTIYLKASPKTLLNRLKLNKEHRPLLKEKSESELFTFISKNLLNRELYYNQSHLIFNTDSLLKKEDIPDSVDKLLQILKTE